MIDIKTLVVSELELIGIPVNYEMFTNEGIAIPSISYLELTNNDMLVGDTLEYDNVTYQIKLWSKDVQYLTETSILINNVMRDLGFRREFAQEIPSNGLLSKVMRFRAITTNII